MQAAFVLWLAAAAPASGATITVNTTDDELGADNRCSLREAISAANNDSAPFAGAGECAAGDASDTVALPAGMFKLSIGGPPDDTNAAGDLDILGTQLAIAGAGAATTIDADHIDRTLDVRPGRIATIQGVTITGGRAPNGSNGSPVVGGTGSNASGPAGADGADGGGIRNAGTLTVLDATVSGNAAGAGGTGGNAEGGAGTTSSNGTDAGAGQAGKGGNGGAGGGIFNGGGLALTRVTVTNNVAGPGGSGGTGTGGQGGGAIVGSGGSGGDGFAGAGGAGGAGGGVAEAGGATLAIDQSSISVNTAGAGGAGGLGQGGAGGVSGGNPGFGGFAGGGVGVAGGAGGAGGGISASDPGAVTNVLIESNTAGAGGAGGNGTGGRGGDVVGSSGTARGGGQALAESGGSGGSGGGMAATPAAATNVTITANASGPGGAAGSATGGAGGGVVQDGTGGNGGFALSNGGGDGGSGGGLKSVGTSTIRHATITSNSLGAGGAGGLTTGGSGGSGGTGGTPGAPGSVEQGSAGSPGAGGGAHAGGTATLQNSIVAGNAAPSCVGVTDGGHDISFPDAACPGANVDPRLAALADNGGPTKTQALESGSPALDAVPMSGAGCAITDQRGVARPQGADCDIGAYEHAPPGVATGEASAVSLRAATLRGQVNPNARASSYHFELGTTTAYGTSTASQTTGAGVSPEAVAAAVSGLAPRTTYHVRLVATNADGTTAGEDRTFTTQAPSDSEAPRFLAAALAPKVFAVDPRGRAEAPVAARAKSGTTFRYRLSEAARVVFTIGRALPGRRVGRACRKRTARNRTRRPCTRYVRVGRFAATASARANRKRFSGRIARRALKPGRYRASLVATDAAGNASPPKRLAFRVVRR